MKKLSAMIVMFIASLSVYGQTEMFKLGTSREVFLHTMGTNKDLFTYIKREDGDFFHLSEYTYESYEGHVVMFTIEADVVSVVTGVYNYDEAKTNLLSWGFHELTTAAGELFWFNDHYICEVHESSIPGSVIMQIIVNPKD